MTNADSVDAADWESWTQETGGVILDIREEHEWELGTLPGALLIPMTSLEERIDELPDDRPILCVCRSGARSDRVATYLRANGYLEAVNLEGGMKALGLQD